MMILKIAVVYLLAINVFGFLLMGWDKGKAKKEQWRVPERRFFLVAFLGGSLGCWLGMQKFRHKTKHPVFVIGIPAIFVLQVLIVCMVYGKFFWIK